MARYRTRTIVTAVIATTWGAVQAATATAQDAGAVRGLVVALETGEPLVGTRVTVVGGTGHTVTDTAGVFELLALSPGEMVLRFEHDGRVKTVEKVTVRPGAVTGGIFELPGTRQVLDALAVFERANPPTAGEVVDTHEDRNPSRRSVAELLDEVSGVQLVRSGGEVGGVFYIRIRGVRSFLFNGPPIVYVDGIRVSERIGSVSVLDLIQPWDVGKVEVLRGPAAATVYGADATNGVILVTTKRGGRSL